jgi:hypothetical protein
MTSSDNNNDNLHASASSSLITADHIAHFKEHGFCVIRDVVSRDAVSDLRRHLHRHVRAVSGVDHARLDASAARKLRESGALSQGSADSDVFLSPTLTVFPRGRPFECILRAVEARCNVQ